MPSDLDVVTGAFSYTGSEIARASLAQDRKVRTLTNHPSRPGADPRIEVHPLTFDDADALARSMAGADCFYNTYWVRFARGDTSFAGAVERSRQLFRAAERAGVQRIVHVSVTNPSLDSPFPYFRGKALVEQALAEVALSWAVVRPTIIFGPGDILMNNLAWLLRRWPVFGIAGDGTYRVRPVHLDDVGELCVELGRSTDSLTVDAVGPDPFTFEELVRQIHGAVRSRSRIVHMNPRLAQLAASMIGLAVRDVLLTDHELGGLMSEKAYSDGPTTGTRGFADWVHESAPRLGLRYESEIGRHFT